MLKKLNLYPKLIAAIVAIAILTACASPATKTIPISEAELKQERQTQKEMAKQYPPKPVKRKHKELSFYQMRLNRVSAPLVKAAKQINKNSKDSYRFRVVDKGGLNAWTDGRSVVFTPEMIDFLEADKELATVIAHELSHNIMGHHGKQTQNFIFGTLLDVAAAGGGVDTGGLFGSIGKMSYSQGFENEADYIGIYLLAIAGYDISNVNHIWRKMTVQTGTGTNSSFFSSHPSNPERFIRMQRAIAEVQAKQKAGQKLVPNFKA